MIKTHHFEDLKKAIKKDIPDFKIAYKDDSLLMATIGFLLYPFNQKFQKGYVTTWGNTVYFPNRSYVSDDVTHAFRVLTHEYVHLMDSKKHGFFGFKVTYALPQVLTLIPLAVYAYLGGWLPLLMVLGGYLLGCYAATKSKVLFWLMFGACVLVALGYGWVITGWWTLLIPASFVFLFLPSPGRTEWELRGYTMSLATVRWIFRKHPKQEYFDHIAGQFTGSKYLFMCPNKGKVDRLLREAYDTVEDGSLANEQPYKMVHDFIVKHGI